MRVPVNLATKPMETHRRFLTLCGTLITLFALPFPWLIWHVYAVRKADAAFRVQNEISTKEIDSLIRQREELDRFFTLPENAKRDFLSALERSNEFSKIELSSVRMSAQGTPGDPIVLELTVIYSGAI